MATFDLPKTITPPQVTKGEILNVLPLSQYDKVTGELTLEGVQIDFSVVGKVETVVAKGADATAILSLTLNKTALASFLGGKTNDDGTIKK